MTINTDQELAELCQTMSKLLNISSLEVREHLSLFIKIHPAIRNCLYYLSQIEDDDLKTSAALSLEFMLKFKQSPFHEDVR
jgi:hypothetical protein